MPLLRRFTLSGAFKGPDDGNHERGIAGVWSTHWWREYTTKGAWDVGPLGRGTALLPQPIWPTCSTSREVQAAYYNSAAGRRMRSESTPIW
jgi:hypothetical protein